MGAHWVFSELQEGVLERRYKRFLADVVLPSGAKVVAHCPNTGSMTGCQQAGSRVWLSHNANPKRKLRWTLELVETPGGLVCVHSALANKVVAAALQQRLLRDLSDFSTLRAEVATGQRSRLDFRLEGGPQTVWVEVKAVSWCTDDGLGLFPDAVSVRATRHLGELVDLISPQSRAALVFCAFHAGITRIAPAEDIDPEYARSLAQAVAKGLEVYGLAVEVGVDGLRATQPLPLEGISGVD